MAIGELCSREVVFITRNESVLAADDLLELLAEEMSGLAGMLGRGALRERTERRAAL